LRRQKGKENKNYLGQRKGGERNREFISKGGEFRRLRGNAILLDCRNRIAKKEKSCRQAGGGEEPAARGGERNKRPTFWPEW